LLLSFDSFILPSPLVPVFPSVPPGKLIATYHRGHRCHVSHRSPGVRGARLQRPS
jgi:hypothetical protein